MLANHRHHAAVVGVASSASVWLATPARCWQSTASWHRAAVEGVTEFRQSLCRRLAEFEALHGHPGAVKPGRSETQREARAVSAIGQRYFGAVEAEESFSIVSATQAAWGLDKERTAAVAPRRRKIRGSGGASCVSHQAAGRRVRPVERRISKGTSSPPEGEDGMNESTGN